MLMMKKPTHIVFATVMTACVAILGAATYSAFNTDCERTAPLNVCGAP